MRAQTLCCLPPEVVLLNTTIIFLLLYRKQLNARFLRAKNLEDGRSLKCLYSAFQKLDSYESNLLGLCRKRQVSIKRKRSTCIAQMHYLFCQVSIECNSCPHNYMSTYYSFQQHFFLSENVYWSFVCLFFGSSLMQLCRTLNRQHVYSFLTVVQLTSLIQIFTKNNHSQKRQEACVSKLRWISMQYNTQ